MPALPPNTSAKILVTGATGYVGQWVLRVLLDRGHTARVVVRSKSKEQAVKDVFPNDASKLEYVVIEDMSKEGAFDEAVVGVDAIVHVATPLPDRDPDNLRIARDTTVGTVKSAFKYGKNVKRIVITSTFGTIWTSTRKETYTYTENDDNEDSMPAFEAGDRDPQTIYHCGKMLAEKAVREFVQEHKNELKFDVVTINPPFVFGPTVQRVSAASELLSTSQILFQGIVNKLEEPPMPHAANSAWVDVRDVAEAHALALEREEAGGERFLVSGGSFVWREWFDVVRAVAPSVLPKDKGDALLAGLPKGEVDYKIKTDASKSEKLLGIKYRSKEELVKGVLEQGLRDGLP